MVVTTNAPVDSPSSTCAERVIAKKPSGWQTLVHGVATLVLVVVGLEAIFSLAGIGEEEYLRPDPILGACGIPNKSITYRKEGFGRFVYNRFGMQDVDRTLAKPPGTKRIVCLGDSLVEALQVDRSENFCHLLESRLNAGAASSGQVQPKFEVLNFGVSMSNLAQMYLRLKHRALAFNPDIAIVPVRVDAALQLSPNAEGGFLTARPNFFADGKGGLIEDRSVQQLWLKSPEGKRMRATAWLREHSHIWGVISIGVEQFAGWVEQMKSGRARWGAAVTEKKTAFASQAAVTKTATSGGTTNGVAVSGAAKLAQQLDAGVNKAPDTRYFGAATRFEWAVAEPLIRQMKEECDQHNCQLVLLRLPGGNDWRNDIETELLQKTADKYSIPMLDTTDAYHKAWLSGQQLFYATHFTPYSHELMATELLKFLRDKGLNK